jgi:indolepyruvate ferredoxin oxidoreductase beta subunit
MMSLNMVLLGSLIQTGIFPVSAEQVKKAIRTSTKKAFVDINVKAFELGFEAAAKAA